MKTTLLATVFAAVAALSLSVAQAAPASTTPALPGSNVTQVGHHHHHHGHHHHGHHHHGHHHHGHHHHHRHHCHWGFYGYYCY